MRRLAFIAAIALLGLLAAPAAAQDSHTLIFAAVKAQGQTGVFLVDTGAPTTLLDAAFARRIGVDLGPDQVIKGGGGLVAGRIAEAVRVQAEDGPTLELDPTVTDLASVSQAFGKPLDGILGADYFARLVLSLDYRSGRASFADPAKVSPPPDAVVLRILATPYVKGSARLEGREAIGSFQIDTGSNAAVVFWAPFAAKAFPQARTTPGASMGLAGVSHSHLAVLDSLDLAGRVLKGLTADLADNLRPDDAGPDFIGAVGGGAFAGKVLHLDYVRARMWMD